MKSIPLIIIIFFSYNLFTQNSRCVDIKNNLKVLNDSSIHAMFDEIKSSKILLIGETHGKKHSILYPKLIEEAISRDFNTVIIELPVSFTLLFEELLKGGKFDYVTAKKITRVVPNKKDFLKTLKAIYEINLIKPFKIMCPDVEHSLVDAKARIYEILDLHKKTLNTNFIDLKKKVEDGKVITITSEGECGDIFLEVINLNEQGKFNDSICLGNHYRLFKNIIEAVKKNRFIAQLNYKENDRENFMINYIHSQFALDTNTKAIGFFGSSHVQLNGDSLFGFFIKNPFAKMLNNEPFFYHKVSTILLNYRYSLEDYNYFQNYLFSFDKKCFNILNSKKEYIYFIDKEEQAKTRLRNYTFLIYL